LPYAEPAAAQKHGQMCAQPVEKHWFISLKGKRYGPYTFAALAEAAAKGVIDADTNVWRLGWVKWHPARRVPGLLDELPPPEPQDTQDSEADAFADDVDERRPVDLDPGDVPGLAGDPPAQSADKRRKAARPPPRPVVDDEDDEDDEDPPPQPPRSTRQRDPRLARDLDGPRKAPSAAFDRSADDDDAPRRIDGAPEIKVDSRPAGTGGQDLPPQIRDDLDDEAPEERRGGGFVKRAAIFLLVVAILGGAAWGVLYGGLFAVFDAPRSNTALDPKPQQPAPTGPAPASMPAPAPAPPSVQAAAANGLPQAVATLPAVATLERNDPADFSRFVTRFTATAVNAPDDELLSLARSALRKSVKRLLANGSGDTLLDITETYLTYMKALQSTSPESCVALSDESKGAKLTTNLAKDFPILFVRDMAVLERVAGTDPNASVAAISAERAQPYLETVFNGLRQLPVQRELLGRDKLTPAEFPAYCSLVIAFYEGVLALPREDKISLLRYLYATAAADGDDDVPK
jgi:hypothetical protein